MKLPPLQTALLSAANLLSFGGITVAKYLRKSSSCSRSAGVRVHEDDAQLLEVLAHLVVDDLGLVLRAHTGQVLALGLGDAQLLEGVLDLVGQVIPGLAGLLGRLDVVVDVVEVDAAEVAAPGRHRASSGRVSRLLWRKSRIHCGSPFIWEISSTISCDRPLRALKT